MTTIDMLTMTHGLPAFIKLDIEGSEYKALDGMTIPVPALSFEFGMGYVEEAYKCVELLGTFKGVYYEFNYTPGHGQLALDEWVLADEFVIDMPEKNEDGKFKWGNVYARLGGE